MYVCMYVCMYIYIYIYIYMYVCIYIYIYREREREREIEHVGVPREPSGNAMTPQRAEIELPKNKNKTRRPP